MFHHLGWCRTFTVINTNEHVCGGKLFILCCFVPLLLFSCRLEPQKHSLSISVLWKGAEPGVLVTLLGSVSRCGAGAGGTAGKLAPALLVGVSLPSAGQSGAPHHLAIPCWEQELTQAVSTGREPLPVLGRAGPVAQVRKLQPGAALQG